MNIQFKYRKLYLIHFVLLWWIGKTTEEVTNKKPILYLRSTDHNFYDFFFPKTIKWIFNLDFDTILLVFGSISPTGTFGVDSLGQSDPNERTSLPDFPHSDPELSHRGRQFLFKDRGHFVTVYSLFLKVVRVFTVRIKSFDFLYYFLGL